MEKRVFSALEAPHGTALMSRRVSLWFVAVLALCFAATAGFAQNNVPVYQTGLVTPGHAATWVTNGVIQDAGGALNGNLTGVGITNTGLPLCINDAPTSNSGGYHQFCFGANATVAGNTGAFITDNAYGGASPLSLYFNINGVNYAFPYTVGGIVGPSTTVVGDLACWNNTTGSLLKDCGIGYVATNTALAAAPIAQYPLGVWRTDYSSSFGAPPEFFVSETGTCSSNSRINDGGSCVNSSDGNSWVGRLPADADVREFGVSYPATLYAVASGGSNTGNYCLSSAAPCATLQYAVNQLQNFSLRSQNPTLDFGSAGAFAVGLTVSGAQLAGTELQLVGHGVSVSGIADTETTQCNAIHVSNGGSVLVSNMTLSTTCSDGADIAVYPVAFAELGTTVTLGAAPLAELFAEENSTITVDLAQTLTLTGGGQYAWLAEDNSTIRMFGSGNITLTGTPAFSVAFADAINNSVIKPGGFNFTGTATGVRYALGSNASIDTEQNTGNLPGSSQGEVVNGSIYYEPPSPCIGGVSGCGILTSPTNIGTGGTITASGTDQVGTLLITAGSSASNSGTFYFAPYSITQNCVVTLSTGGTASWTAGSTVVTDYGNFGGTFGTQVIWYNNGVALTNALTYQLNYYCA